MNQTKERYFDVSVFLLILAVVLVQIIRLGEYPGLYLDAINPDYIAVQLLHPSEDSMKWQIAWPWLCQVYHGNVGIVITLFSTLLTGGTGVVQYHITYGLITAICVFLFYRVLINKRVGLARGWAAAVVVCMASWPSLLTIIITQYYMSLFGTMCILTGILLFLGWLDERARLGRLLVCYLLFGLAFYSYFNFLFFLPSLLVATVLALRKRKCTKVELADVLLTNGIVYLLGCGFYVAGYSQIALFHYRINMDMPRIMGLFIGIYLLLFLLYMLFYKRVKGRYVVLGIYMAGVAVWMYKVLPTIKEAATGLKVLGTTPSTFLQKVQTIIGDFGNILSGRYAEIMISGKAETVGNEHLIRFLLVLLLITVVIEVITKKQDLGWKAVVGIMGVFFLCSLAFGTRMQPQHYVPLLFFTFAFVALSIRMICRGIGYLVIGRKTKDMSMETSKADVLSEDSKIRKVLQGISFFAVVAVLLLNVYNQNRIIHRLRETGGDGMWAYEMTTLAEDALEHKERGDKEVYVFYDWGFMTGFNYLTENRVPIVANWDLGILSQYYNEGNDIVICYWEKEKEGTNKTILDLTANFTGKIENSAVKDKNGRVEFYKMTLFHQK